MQFKPILLTALLLITINTPASLFDSLSSLFSKDTASETSFIEKLFAPKAITPKTSIFDRTAQFASNHKIGTGMILVVAGLAVYYLINNSKSLVLPSKSVSLVEVTKSLAIDSKITNKTNGGFGRDICLEQVVHIYQDSNHHTDRMLVFKPSNKIDLYTTNGSLPNCTCSYNGINFPEIQTIKRVDFTNIHLMVETSDGKTRVFEMRDQN